jgi:membrane dipeptidase
MTARQDLRWFDAHLDLAAMAVNGRDMLARPEDVTGPWPPASVTLRSLRDGSVASVLGTIFLEPDGKDAEGYPAGDDAMANVRGLEQLAWYHAMARQGHVHLATASIVEGSTTPGQPPANPTAPTCRILVEGADPIRSPDELPWWRDRGVAAVGLAWARASRFAGGNTEAHGLTDLGRAMARALDALAIVHDLSHLSDRACDELLDLASGRVVASHSNCRALLGDARNQRHLRDDTIRAIAARNGVIGLNLFSRFLIPAHTPSSEPIPRATLDAAADHVLHICNLTGSASHVGLGSDMDGGFSALALPMGIDRPTDLWRLAERLSRRGMPDADLHAFAWGNWSRFWDH